MIAAVHALLHGLVDYAGLFPPTAHAMPEAVGEYAKHRSGPHAWMLGRFVLPATRLGEFAQTAGGMLAPTRDAWRLSVLLGEALRADVDATCAFNAEQRGALCDVAEAKAATPDAVAAIARATNGTPLTVYAEIPVDNDPAPLVAAIARHGLRAKVRTGGVTPDAFPPPGAIVRFIASCLRAGVAFKATAGLHHPLRGDHPLTYEPASPTVDMHGFLNVLLATAVLCDGGSEDDALAALAETDADCIVPAAGGLVWRERQLPTTRLRQCRASGMIAVGSCSFAEPVDDLAALGWLA